MARGDRRSAFVREYVYGVHAGNAAASARAAGYSERTSDRIGQRLLSFVEVHAEVERLTVERNAAIQAKGIAERQYRLDAANERHQLLHQIIAERAGDEALQGIPGGGTGLMVRTPLLVKVYEQRGEDEDGEELVPTKATRIAYEYAVDTGLLKEMRELEKQVAQDAGQWTEKREMTGKDGGPIALALIDAVIADGNDPLA